MEREKSYRRDLGTGAQSAESANRSCEKHPPSDFAYEYTVYAGQCCCGCGEMPMGVAAGIVVGSVNC